MSRVIDRTFMRAQTIRAGRQKGVFNLPAAETPFGADMRAIARPARDTDPSPLIADEKGNLWRAYILRPAYRRRK